MVQRWLQPARLRVAAAQVAAAQVEAPLVARPALAIQVSCVHVCRRRGPERDNELTGVYEDLLAKFPTAVRACSLPLTWLAG